MTNNQSPDMPDEVWIATDQRWYSSERHESLPSKKYVPADLIKPEPVAPAGHDPLLMEVLQLIENCRSMQNRTGGGEIVDKAVDREDLRQQANILWPKLEAVKWGVGPEPVADLEALTEEIWLSDPDNVYEYSGNREFIADAVRYLAAQGHIRPAFPQDDDVSLTDKSAEEALNSAIASHRRGELGEWELELIRRRLVPQDVIEKVAKHLELIQHHSGEFSGRLTAGVSMDCSARHAKEGLAALGPYLKGGE